MFHELLADTNKNSCTDIKEVKKFWLEHTHKTFYGITAVVNAFKHFKNSKFLAQGLY